MHWDVEGHMTGHVRLVQKVRAGELVLMDAGCELHGYSSDVTRTWPVSGTFNKHQRTVYEIVLDTHRCASCMHPVSTRRLLKIDAHFTFAFSIVSC